MFDPKIDICPDGYDIDQTNFYLNSLHNKIESLEKQNAKMLGCVLNNVYASRMLDGSGYGYGYGGYHRYNRYGGYGSKNVRK